MIRWDMTSHKLGFSCFTVYSQERVEIHEAISFHFLKEIFRCVKETDVKKIFSIIIPLTICIRLSAPHNGIELVWI